MAIVLQNSGVPFEGQDASNSSSSLTKAVTVASGTGTKMLICIGGEGGGTGGDREVTSVTVNGNAGLATLLGRAFATNWGWAEIWGVESPPVGTYNVVSALNGADAVGCYIYVADGCDTTGFTVSQNIDGGSFQQEVTLPDAVAGDFLVDIISVDGNQTASLGVNPGLPGGSDVQGLSSFATLGTQWGVASGGDTVGWDWSSAADNSMVAVGFQAPVIPPQKVYPDADVTTTGWSTAPLWSKVEEVSADGTVIVGTFS